MHALRSRSWLLAVCALLLCAGGCDDTFTAYSGSDRYFSIFGYLDAARDTQWVRIESLQDSLFLGTDSTRVRVTLEDLETGERDSLREEIRDYLGNDLRNFGTPMDIRPGATYRLSVERLRDGATSRAEVTIPAQPPDVEFSGGTAGGAVTIRDIERLGALLAVYSNGVELSYLDDATHIESGAYRASIPVPDDFSPLVRLQSVTVAGVSEDWPRYGFPVGEPEPLPPVGGGATNVEHGVGYVGGAITRTVFTQQ